MEFKFREPITAKRFLPPPKPGRWPAEELERMDAPIDEGSRFLAWAHGGRNVFLTGMAGTGKSWLLRKFISERVGHVSVTAPTGVAALNVGGMTLHRFCGMRLGPGAGQSDEAFYRELKDEHHPAVMAGFRRVRRCEVLEEGGEVLSPGIGRVVAAVRARGSDHQVIRCTGLWTVGRPASTVLDWGR